MTRNSRLLVGSVFASLFSLAPHFVQAQPKPQGGGIPIRVIGAESRCINLAKDQVYLTLYRVVVNKDSGFFKKQTAAEIIIKVQVQTADSLNFPLSAKVNISGTSYPNGQISIPVEYPLVSGLPLTTTEQGKTTVYKGLGVDITVVNLESKTVLGDALEALVKATGDKKLPIPTSPIASAGSYLLGFANDAVTNSIKNHNDLAKLTSDSLSLTFAPKGVCPADGGFEMTGVKAILWADNDLKANPGYVDIGQTNDYCWVAETTPGFVLKAARIVPGKACNDASYGPLYRPLANNFQAFLLQSVPVADGLGPNVKARTDAIKDAKTLCDKLGMTSCAVK